jgi:Sec-independent protein translocase protein TatA
MIGSNELLVVLLLSLILFGPDKLIHIARVFGDINKEITKLIDYAPDERKRG